MSTYSLSHLSDHLLLRDLTALVAQDRANTARLLAHLAEVDARRLYLPAGYPSMYAYCVDELRLSEDGTYKRIRAARTAREFPAIFDAVADGRLNLSGIVLLTPHLTPGNAGELLSEAAGKSKPEIEELLARRFPRSEMLPMIEAVSRPNQQLAPGPVGGNGSKHGEASGDELAPGQVAFPVPRSKATPIAAQRFALQLTMSQSTHDKLRYAQELLSHQIPNGGIAEVLERALDALILELEKRKFAATLKPRPRQRRSNNPRTIPAHVRRAVRQRDGRQCTFVTASGHRCPARTQLEFDHIDEVARGGVATVAGIRLRCRAHNQYAAELTFGAQFMRHKRQGAREEQGRAARARAARAARVSAFAANETPEEQDIIPWLKALGFRADEARRAAERCERIPDAPLEQRVRVALMGLGPKACRGRLAPAQTTCGP